MKGVLADGSAKKGLAVVHADPEDGFVVDAQLMYKAGSVIVNYHSQVNSTNLEKSIQEKLISNLPKNSMVIFDNVPYHCI